MSPLHEIRSSFNHAAKKYLSVGKVQQEIGNRLFERLEYVKITPRYILDLGSGPGWFTRELKKRYPKAEIVAVDVAENMIKEGNKLQTWRKKWHSVVASMDELPLASGIFDLVFSNQVIHWSHNPSQLFSEIFRVMNSHSCLMFSTLGPDTFKEIKMAWQPIDNFRHVLDFSDMHDLGDVLLNKQFQDPVVDMEHLKVHYSSLSALFTGLKSQGVRNVNLGRNPGLTGKTQWQRFTANYEQLKTEEGKYPLGYEVIYGHAWKGAQHHDQGVTETRISLDTLRSTLRSKS